MDQLEGESKDFPVGEPVLVQHTRTLYRRGMGSNGTDFHIQYGCMASACASPSRVRSSHTQSP